MSSSRRALAWLEERLNLTEIFSFFTTFGLSYGSIDLNKPLAEASKEAFARQLPAYTRGPYILGVLTFGLFIMQGVTGLLLSLYYQPSPETAYESTLLIIREVNFGWYVHQMHWWGSNMLIALLLVRLGRFFIHGVYKKPRELTWIFGAILLLLSVKAALTGTLLPWDQRSYWSVTRGLEVVGSIPVAGRVLAFLTGGFEIQSVGLLRFYVLHIIFIPLAMVFFFYLHFATVRKVGLSALPTEEKVESKPLYPDHLFQLVVISLFLFGVILTLGTIFPSRIWMKADPFADSRGIGPPWYLLPAFAIRELLPHWIAGVLIALIGAGVVLLPFIERKPYRSLKQRPVLAGIAGLFVLLIIVLAIVGYQRVN